MRAYTLADLRKLESRIISPLDPERELHDARRFRFVMYEGDVYRVKTIMGGTGSGLTGTWAETLYSNSSAGAALATFTAEAIMYGATQPEAWIPADFFDPTYGLGKTLRIVARGIWSDTTAAPTFTPGLRIGAAAAVTGSILGSNAALTCRAVSLSNIGWEIECDIVAQTPVLASAHNEAVLITMGETSGVSAAGADLFCNASAIGTQTPGTALTLAQADATQYIVPTATCGTSNASNKWQMLQLVVMALN